MRRHGFVTGFAAAVACVVLLGAAGQIDPIFNTIEVDDDGSVFHAEVDFNDVAEFTGTAEVSGVLSVSGIAAGRSSLPASPNVGDVALYTGDNLRELSGWDSGTPGPPGGGLQLSAVVIDSQGDVVLAAGGHVWRMAAGGTTWDSGIPSPNFEAMRGLSVDSSDNVVLSTARGVYVRANDAWGTRISPPTSEQPQGVAINGDGDILLVGALRDRVYTRSGGVWDDGVPGPSGETAPRGLDWHAGDWYLSGATTYTIYTRPRGRDGNWRGLLAAPEQNFVAPFGVDVSPIDGDVLVTISSIFRATRTHRTNPVQRGWAIWTGSNWRSF